jgi:hypothetical protein
MNDYKDLGFNGNVQYELTSENHDFIEYVANKIHEKLKGHPDYINNHVILYYENAGYLDVIVWPLEATVATPDFLISNSNWLLFCVALKKKYEGEKSNG